LIWIKPSGVASSAETTIYATHNALPVNEPYIVARAAIRTIDHPTTGTEHRQKHHCPKSDRDCAGAYCLSRGFREAAFYFG
jgi:hypothetical protein